VKWTLLLVFLPLTDGPIVGWKASYNTEQECRAEVARLAKSELSAARVPGRKTYAVARCTQEISDGR